MGREQDQAHNGNQQRRPGTREVQVELRCHLSQHPSQARRQCPEGHFKQDQTRDVCEHLV